MSNIESIHVLQIVKGIDIGGKNGGAESFGIRLARELHRRGISVSLCALIQHGTAVEQYWMNELEQAGIRIFFACPSGKMELIEARRNIKNWIARQHVTLIHSHNHAGTIISLVLRLTKEVQFLVRTAHVDLEFGEGLGGILSRVILRAFLYPLIIDREAGVSRTITQSLNQQWVRKVVDKPAVWIPNAIPSAIPSVNSTNISDDPLRDYVKAGVAKPWLITTIGLLVARKNIDVMINAMPEVLSKIQQARLVVVGGGAEAERLRKLANDLNLSESCWFLGQQQDASQILAQTDILLLASRSEGVSTVILEAMQHKVPVIASDIPGNRELIEDKVNGWLVPLGDTSALSKAIIHAYQHPEEMKRMAEEALKQLKNYEMPQVCQKYIDLYNSSGSSH